MQNTVNEERVDLVALAWLWCQRGKPATVAALAGGIKAMLPAGAAKQLAPSVLERLQNAGHAERIEPAKKRGAVNFKITAAGEARARGWLGSEELPAGGKPFGSISSYALPAIAAGLPVPRPDKKSQSALAKMLPIRICVERFALAIPLDRGPEAAQLELIKLALSRASQVETNRIYLKTLPKGVLPALVVAPLVGEPGTAIASIDKLLGVAAAKILDSTMPIKSAVVRRWLCGGTSGAAAAPVPAPAVDRLPAPNASTAPPRDLAIFSRQALAAAGAVARAGGPGVSSLGDKVLVHYVWHRYEQMFGPMPLEQFKRQLSDANVDYLVLVREDLIPQAREQEFKDSEVRTGASSYHYIRVSNLGEHHA